MKKILTVICMLLVLATAASATSLSSRMTRYIDNIEKKCKEWTKEDWNASKEQYKVYIEEYNANKDSYSQEENDEINKAIGRYNGLLIKHGMEELGDYLEGLGKRIPSLLKGFKSAFEGKEKK